MWTQIVIPDAGAGCSAGPVLHHSASQCSQRCGKLGCLPPLHSASLSLRPKVFLRECWSVDPHQPKIYVCKVLLDVGVAADTAEELESVRGNV